MLMGAAGNSEAPYIQKILQTGANPATADKMGRTSLHLVCRQGRVDNLLALIAHDEDLEMDV